MNTHRPITTRFLALTLLVLGLAVRGVPAQFENGSFESGFDSWVVQDMEDPYVALGFGPAGLTLGAGTFPTQPTDGDLVAYNGFDGGGPGTIVLAQDVLIPLTASRLLFDYGAAWDVFSSATQDRQFQVLVEPAGGGPAMRTVDVLTARVGTAVSNSGLVTAAVDLEQFKGEMVRVKFAWFVPEYFTGPGFFQLDNVRLAARKAPASEVVSLRLKLNLKQVWKDSLKLSLIVPTQPGFYPGGQPVDVSVGGLSKQFVLDANGKASMNADVLRVRPDPSHAGFQKLTLSCKKGNFLADLMANGLLDVDTAKGGEAVLLPISVTLDTLTTDHELMVIYKARESGRGVARGKTPTELKRARVDVTLNFAAPDKDKVSVRAFGFGGAGYLPEGQALTVEVGSLTKSFVLDAHGRAQDGDDRVFIRRDKRDPSCYQVTLKCSKGDFAETFAPDGLLDESIPKPGITVPLPVQLRLGDGELKAQVLFETTWRATAGKRGKARGVM